MNELIFIKVENMYIVMNIQDLINMYIEHFKALYLDKIIEHIKVSLGCIDSTTLKGISFNERYKYGSLWEKYLSSVYEYNYKCEVSQSIGLNKEFDLDIKGKYKVEVKSTKRTNEKTQKYNSYLPACKYFDHIFIKCEQWNYSTNDWDKASLLCGDSSIQWFQLFLYNDKWHYFRMSKRELFELCKSKSSLKYGLMTNSRSAPAQGFYLSVNDIPKFKQVRFSLKLNH